MKNLILLILLAAFFPAFTQNYIDALPDEKKADQLLDKLRSKQATEEERKELSDIANAIQDRAHDLDEKQHQPKKAVAEIEKAIVFFNALNDTLNLANNRKYKGYLLGRMGKFKEAKNETEAAIDLYRLSKINAGVAISQFDLARMFEFENTLDSAIYYADLSRSFWKTKQADQRVMIADNMLVSLFLKSNQPEKARSVQEESSLLVKRPDMHWQSVIDYYFTSMLLFRTINNIAVAGDYQQLYLSKIAALKSQGIIAKSYYERDRE